MQNVFGESALYRDTNLSVTGAGDAGQIRGEFVEATYFPLLGIPAKAGRVFLPEEDSVPERDMVAMISHKLWVDRYGADPGAIGKTILFNLQPYRIVGVVPADFRPLTGMADVWLPIHTASARQLSSAQSHSFQMVARRKAGVSAEQAAAAVTAVGARIEEIHPDPVFKGWGAKARTFDDARADPAMRKAVLVLFVAVSFVLLIACVNIANLLLARGSARRREIAIRLAVGANRLRLVRQLLTESIVLSLLGSVGGLGIAYAGVQALSVINPANGTAFGIRMSGLTVLGLTSIRLDLNALAFTLCVALATGMLFGLAPALQASRVNLKASGFAGRNLLVIAEVALAVVLLAGAGLMIKSFGRLLATRTGVDPTNVLTARITLPNATDAQILNFFPQLESLLAAAPGVVSAGLANCFALAGGCNGTPIWFRDRPAVPAGTEQSVGVHLASPTYFQTMRIPLRRGRWFTNADRMGAPPVVVVNESAARQFWPGEDAVGHLVAVGQRGFRERAEVIGVVADVRYGQMDELPRSDVYVPFLQSPQSSMIVDVRTRGSAAAFAGLLREQVRALNRDLPVYDIRTMEERILESTGKARFSATLLGVFAGIALLLSAVGIYGVMAYVVTQRTREIGIRMALGARPGDVLGLMVQRAGALAGIGIAIGVGGALAATRTMESLLYQVRTDDTATYVMTGVGLLVVAMGASYVPARRAARVDPSGALKGE